MEEDLIKMQGFKEALEKDANVATGSKLFSAAASKIKGMAQAFKGGFKGEGMNMPVVTGKATAAQRAAQAGAHIGRNKKFYGGMAIGGTGIAVIK